MEYSRGPQKGTQMTEVQLPHMEGQAIPWCDMSSTWWRGGGGLFQPGGGFQDGILIGHDGRLPVKHEEEAN